MTGQPTHAPLSAVSLCSGYGGLDLAVEAVTGAETVAFAELKKAPAQVFARHWPDARPLGDLTQMDWSTVEADIVMAGFPCQDLSYAGKGRGIVADSRSGLWYAIEHVLRVLRPRFIVLENVAAIVARRPGLDVVLAGLASLGFDARWCCVRASDVGAPHRRERWFLVACDPHCVAGAQGSSREGRRGTVDESGEVERVIGPDGAPSTHAPGVGRPEGRTGTDGRRTPAGREGTAADTGGQRHGEGQDDRGLGRLDRQDAGQTRQRQRARQESGDRGATAPADTHGGGLEGIGRDTPLERDAHGRDGARQAAAAWGDYGPAIARWEHVLRRPAPAPTDDRGRLSPVFVEWMMGLPAGWVSDTPGLSRAKQLECLGNGVVPQQAVFALSGLLERTREMSA